MGCRERQRLQCIDGVGYGRDYALKVAGCAKSPLVNEIIGAADGKALLDLLAWDRCGQQCGLYWCDLRLRVHGGYFDSCGVGKKYDVSLFVRRVS